MTWKKIHQKLQCWQHIGRVGLTRQDNTKTCLQNYLLTKTSKMFTFLAKFVRCGIEWFQKVLSWIFWCIQLLVFHMGWHILLLCNFPLNSTVVLPFLVHRGLPWLMLDIAALVSWESSAEAWVIMIILAPRCTSTIAWKSGLMRRWWVDWIVLLWGMQISNFSRCLGCIAMGGDSMLVSILTASGISRMLVRLCFGGLCLVCPAIDSLVQTQGGQFSFHWPLRNSFALLSI